VRAFRTKVHQDDGAVFFNLSFVIVPLSDFNKVMGGTSGNLWYKAEVSCCAWIYWKLKKNIRRVASLFKVIIFFKNTSLVSRLMAAVLTKYCSK
jgi:hypothetical protein